MENNKDAAQLLLNDTLKKNTFSMSYLDYLSRYNNNVLSFSAPKKIDVEPSEEIYNKLFNKFIDDSEIVTTISKTNNADVFKVNNRVQLIKHFNVDREFTSIEIPKLIAPVKVDLLGKNEIPVYVQAVDLDKKIYHIEYELAQLVLLNLAFTEEKKPAKGFVLSREPDRKEVTQHNIWKQLRSSKQFEYIDLSEPEKILDYAKKHGVQPLVANITE